MILQQINSRRLKACVTREARLYGNMHDYREDLMMRSICFQIAHSATPGHVLPHGARPQNEYYEAQP